MNNVVRIMNDELLNGPVRLSVWLTRAVEGVFTALRRMEEVLQKNQMVPDMSTYLHTMLALTRSRWKPAYEQARSEQGAAEQRGGAREDDTDRVRAYVERLAAVMKANREQITKRANDARKLQINQAHRSLDRRQGEIRRFDVVRLLQVARDDPTDVYGPRPGRTVGGVYRNAPRGSWARTPPAPIRTGCGTTGPTRSLSSRTLCTWPATQSRTSVDTSPPTTTARWWAQSRSRSSNASV